MIEEVANMRPMSIVIVGAGDHARVLVDVIKGKRFSEFEEWEIVALTDDNPEMHGRTVRGIRVVGGRQTLPELKQQGVEYALVGVGLSSGTDARAAIYQELKKEGFQFPIVLHPSALVASHVEIGAASVILAGTIVGTGCQIGRNVIINVGASVSHDCCIGDHTVVSDRACLTGGIRVEEGAVIGAGATLNPYVAIGRNAIVGAGAVVTKNVRANTTVVGVPAKPIEKRP